MAESGKISEAISAVERQIAGLWAPEHGAPPKSRACTANIVVVAAAHEVREAVALGNSLATADLARTFVVHVDPKMAPWGIEASVSAHCQKDDSGVVCAERIDLVLGAMTFARAASIIDTLAVSEVPTVLVVASAAPPLLVSALARAVSRVIVDGENLGLDATQAIARETSAHLVDITWERLHPWRNQMARCFDSVSMRPAVRALRRVEIAYREGSMERARRLVGWLSSRLGWTIDSATHALDAQRLPVEIVLSPRTAEAPAGAILEVSFTAGLDEGETTFSLIRYGDPPRVDTQWTTKGGAPMSRSAPIITPTLADLVDRAIADPTSDAVLRQTLAAAVAYPPPAHPQPSTSQGAEA